MFLQNVLLVVLFSICFIQIISIHKQKMVIQNLRIYNNTLIDMVDGIRSLKHDYMNFIQCLKGYTLCNDMDGIKEMVDSVYEESKNICNMELLNPDVINNPAIYNLLLNKYNEAENKNISMNIEVNFDLKDLDIDIYTLSRILGILVDNAIESAESSQQKQIYIRFVIENHEKCIFIQNSYNDSKKIDLERIFEKGYSTKEESKEHGLGLWKVKQLVQRIPNLELITNVDNLFSQELIIKDKRK